jgi:capsular polysaccharide biosynthesis protein
VTMRFTASQIPGSSATNFQDQSYIPWLASEYVVNNLASWMKTESFAREITDNLKAQSKLFDVNALRGSIAADSARSIMMLAISWPNADDLKLIAQAAIDVLQHRSQAYFPQFGTTGVVVTPMDAIDIAPQPAALSSRLAPLVRLLIGLVAGLALAFLAEYLDPTIRSRDDASALELPVIAEIPRY